MPYDGMLRKFAASTFANPAEWLVEAFGGSQADAGVRVNYADAMSYAYVWSATNIIAGDVGGMPLDFFKVEADGDRVRAYPDSVWFLLNGDGNESMSSYSVRELLTSWALLRGNGLAYIVRNGAGVAEALIPAIPGTLRAMSDDSGTLWYRDDENDANYHRRDIFHIKGLGDDGVWGHSVLSLARNSFGLGLAQEKHGAAHFKNGAEPKIVLRHPAPLDKQQADALLDSFMARHSGTDNGGRPALAAGGLEIETLSISNEDAQWLESRKFSRSEVAVWFGMPPHKLGDDSRVAYNSLESENRAYVQQTLRRWLRRWETEVERKLLRESDRRQRLIFVRHDAKQLLESDAATKVEYLAKMREAKLITGNEGRKELGFPRIDGEDVLENPNTSTTTSDDGESTEPAQSAPNEALEAHRALVAERIGRLFSVMQAAAQRATKRDGAFACEAWRETWRAKANEILSPALAACASLPGVTIGADCSDLVEVVTGQLLDDVFCGDFAADSLSRRIVRAD